MGFESFNLDEVAEMSHRRSNGDRSADDIYFDTADMKMKTSKKGAPIPVTATVTNKMTDEGFA